MQISENMPPSIFYNDGKCLLDYRFRAQFVPHSDSDWVDEEKTLSCLRSKDLFIKVSRPLNPNVFHPGISYHKTLTTKSKMLGCIGSDRETKTVFEWNQALVEAG